ncbi:hypothetical protein Tco_0011880 [Tanacetum coccineum]
MISTLDSLSSSSANEIKGDCQGGIDPCDVGLDWEGDGFVVGLQGSCACCVSSVRRFKTIIQAIQLSCSPSQMISTLDSLSSSSANEIKGDCQGGIDPCDVGLDWEGDGFVVGLQGVNESDT